MVTLNAVDVFEPSGISPIPTDIQLAPCNDDPIGDEFHTLDTQSMSFDRDNPISIDCLPPDDISDPYDDTSDDYDSLRGNIDTGTTVSCTNRHDALWNYRPYTKLHPSPIRLKAALGKCVFPTGHGYLRCRTSNGHTDVHTYFSPELTGTLISPTSILKSCRGSSQFFSGQTIHRWFSDEDRDLLTGNMSVVCHHKLTKSKNIVMHGRLIAGQLYTHPLILPDVQETNLIATAKNCLNLARKCDTSFADVCANAVKTEINLFKLRKHKQLNDCIRHAPSSFKGFNLRGLDTMIDKAIPVNAIRTRTEKLLWHHRLGHPCDEYLYNAHKYIDGVPKFSQESSVLDQCPTCIQAKQTEAPLGTSLVQT